MTADQRSAHRPRRPERHRPRPFPRLLRGRPRLRGARPRARRTTAASPSSARTASSSSPCGSRPTAPSHPALAGLHHLAFQADAIEEVRAAEERLRALGADFAYEGVVAHGEGAASGGIFFHDPDGTRLEIYAPSGAEGAPGAHRRGARPAASSRGAAPWTRISSRTTGARSPCRSGRA